jgi:hypothetical protein
LKILRLVSSFLLTVLIAFGLGGPSVRLASFFPGADLGERINAAYADLPPGGGAILLSEGGSFSTPIVFSTEGKPVVLEGLPADVVTLT